MFRNAQVRKNIKLKCLLRFLDDIVFLGNILMVVGGRKTGTTGAYADEINTDKTYAFSLDDSVPVPSCLQSLVCDFPRYFRGAVSAIFDDGLPTVCGGQNGDPHEVERYNDCYKFNFTDGWREAGSFSKLKGFLKGENA